VEKRLRPSSEEGNEEQKQQHAEGVGSRRARGEAVKKKYVKCPYNRQRSQCWQYEGSSTCEHRSILRLCKQSYGLGICQHNRRNAVGSNVVGRSFASTTSKEAISRNTVARASAKIIENNRTRSQKAVRRDDHLRSQQTTKEANGITTCSEADPMEQPGTGLPYPTELTCHPPQFRKHLMFCKNIFVFICGSGRCYATVIHT
jgi:hypothetical protein